MAKKIKNCEKMELEDLGYRSDNTEDLEEKEEVFFNSISF